MLIYKLEFIFFEISRLFTCSTLAEPPVLAALSPTVSIFCSASDLVTSASVSFYRGKIEMKKLINEHLIRYRYGTGIN